MRQLPLYISIYGLDLCALIPNCGLPPPPPPPPEKTNKQKRGSIIYRNDRQENEAYKTISCYFSVGQEINCLALILGSSLAVSSSQNMWNFSPFSTALPKQSSFVPRAYPVILTSFYRVANFSAFEHQHGRRVIAHFYQVAPSLFFKARLIAKPLICKWYLFSCK